MIIFETPGLIDIRAFTTGGLSAKPNSSNPIGRFGTGLKYAIAVLVRRGASPIVWIGQDRYTFSRKPIVFRDKNFDLIRMRRDRWSVTKPSYYEMPFTTEYGKDWKLWQVFRELEANTRDEGGATWKELGAASPTAADMTRIVVDHPDFDKVYEERDTVFLPQDRVPLNQDRYLQQFEGESKYLFWRGMRVLELGKPSVYTWNFIREMTLTEDRTLSSEWLARTYVAEWLAEQRDEAMIRRLVTVSEDYWESSMDFGYATRPSPQFRVVMLSRPSGVLRSAQTYHDRYEPAPEEPDVMHLPWKVVGDYVETSTGEIVMQAPATFLGPWHEIAEQMCEKVNR